MYRTLAALVAVVAPVAVLAGGTPAGGAAVTTADRVVAAHLRVAAPGGSVGHAGRLPGPALEGTSAAQTSRVGPSGAASAAALTSGSLASGSLASGSSASGSSVTIEGHGLGHGRGMGQYGAYGYASERQYRWSWVHIVDHYYGGAHLERVSSSADRASIDVNLSELDSATVTVVRPHRPGAELRINDGRKHAGTLVVRHRAGLQNIRATSGDVSVELPGIGWRSYQGYVQIQAAGAPNGTGGQTWNVVPVEDYVAGVVPGESPAAWGAAGGEAALQAQAVAARSYSLAYVAAVGRTCDTTACQYYGGDPSTAGLGSYARYSDAATSSTAGRVVCTVAASTCPAADIAATEYSSSTGGYTAGGIFPPVVDTGDAIRVNPFHDWTTTIGLATIEANFPSAGRVTALFVTRRNGHGRAIEVTVRGSAGRVVVTADQFAADLGLDSDWFRFATEP